MKYSENQILGFFFQKYPNTTLKQNFYMPPPNANLSPHITGAHNKMLVHVNEISPIG